MNAFKALAKESGCAMPTRKPTYEELEKQLAQVRKKNRLLIANSADTLRHTAVLLNERSTELIDTKSILKDEVLRRGDAEQALRSMTARLVTARQEERRHLRHLLHDELQQLLVASIYQINTLNNFPEKEIQSIVLETENLLRQAIQLTRTLTTELCPPALEETSLLPAFDWLANWMKEKHGLNVVFSMADQISVGKLETRVLLFESVRELLFNVVKHAGVKTAFLELQRYGDQIQIQVRDEGSGFDTAVVLDDGLGINSLGLIGIRERLIFMGGSMNAESSPGRGSKFTLLVPAA